MSDPETTGRGRPDGPPAAGRDADAGLRDRLAEAIASLRSQAAVMLSRAPGRVGEAEATGPEGRRASRHLARTTSDDAPTEPDTDHTAYTAHTNDTPSGPAQRHQPSPHKRQAPRENRSSTVRGQ
ncbi:hypothetical protein [Streptomyces sp. NWU339]|uniref:hypothetical protein n=1 Tax=Streptomyces sp. NWU339 TaxID=2185284 RepID=UPI0011B75CD3|nr:hypothetical protein [Streptomyces sp. NWU339]